MLIVSMIGTIGVLFALFWKARSYPLNYGLLAVFTLLEAHAVGTIGKSQRVTKNSSIDKGTNNFISLIVTFYNQKLVLQALIITLGVFIALTVFTLQSKWDFTGLAPL